MQRKGARHQGAGDVSSQAPLAHRPPANPCFPALPLPRPPPPPPPPAGDDISRPATNAREAVQWLYYAYLGAVKEQVGWGPLHLAVQQP